MGNCCLADDSHEMSSLIFSEKWLKNIAKCCLLQLWLALLRVKKMAQFCHWLYRNIFTTIVCDSLQANNKMKPSCENQLLYITYIQYTTEKKIWIGIFQLNQHC